MERVGVEGVGDGEDGGGGGSSDSLAPPYSSLPQLLPESTQLLTLLPGSDL